MHPDLIVTDLSMPVMNGLEETRALKKLMPLVPVITFTAHSDPFVEKEARAAGVSAIVSKSQAVAALTAKLGACSSKSRPDHSVCESGNRKLSRFKTRSILSASAVSCSSPL